MEKPLRLGVAGLGVVGTSLVQLLQRRSSEFVARAGRECVLAAYSARRKRTPGRVSARPNSLRTPRRWPLRRKSTPSSS